MFDLIEKIKKYKRILITAILLSELFYVSAIFLAGMALALCVYNKSLWLYYALASLISFIIFKTFSHIKKLLKEKMQNAITEEYKKCLQTNEAKGDDNNGNPKPNEKCWETGNYTDNCDCYLCGHKDKCSGYDKEKEDD